MWKRMTSAVSRAWEVRAPPLTLAGAILLGAGMIALALLLAPLVAPYRFNAAGTDGFLRFNAVTGEAIICAASVVEIACSNPYQPDRHTVDRIVQGGAK